MKSGDIYRLGSHRLAYGSSSDTDLLARLVSADKVAMVLTDPPYGVSYVESKRGIASLATDKVIANDNIGDETEYKAFSVAWIEAVKPHLARKNSIYIFNSDKMLVPTVEAMKSTGCKFAQLLIWAKTHAVVGRLDYLPQHELILYGWYGTHTFKKSKDKSILVYPRPNRSKLHPTMKPVGLLRRLLLNSSSVRDIVFDGFAGSGSTLLACEQTNRQCLAVELDPEYCQVIIDRWERLTGQTAELLI
ncbi:MAG TPA: site-specific DNA-methyltransferase [Candidatus Saccharimonadales bacterium]|jgi:site-specific DNA-methyltransferase (adenine-specific)